MFNLADYPEYIPSYVKLRNMYKEELNTAEITVESTEKWLERDTGTIFCWLIEGPYLGAMITVRKSGEITICSRFYSMGDIMVKRAEIIAKEMGLTEVFAYVRDDNERSKKCFIRNGYELRQGLWKKKI